MTNWGERCPDTRAKKLSYIQDKTCTAESCSLGFFAPSFAVNRCPAEYPYCGQAQGEYYCSNIQCEPNQHIEEGHCVDNSLTDCGIKGYDCASLVTGWKSGQCEFGACVVSACQDDYTLDNGTCKKNTVESCGKAQTNCQATVEGWQNGICENGACVVRECQFGYELDAGVCVPRLITSCGLEHVNCTTTVSGWRDGKCQAGKCQISACVNEYHLTQADQTLACEPNSTTSCGPSDQVAVSDCSAIANVRESSCVDGACVVKACQSGYHIYQNACEADTVENCGSHGAGCDGTCDEGVCHACTNDMTRCEMTIEDDPVTGIHNLAVYRSQTCVDQQWQEAVPCQNGYICDEAGKTCVDPNDEELSSFFCDDEDQLRACKAYGDTTYYVVCFGGVTPQACVGDTSVCMVDGKDGCVDVPDCSEKGVGYIPDASGHCVCDVEHGFTPSESGLGCIESCENGTKRCSSEGAVQACYDNFWESTMTCGSDEICREDDSYYYCAATCTEEASLCKNIDYNYDEDTGEYQLIYAVLSCQTDHYLGFTKLCADGCNEDKTDCKEATVVDEICLGHEEEEEAWFCKMDGDTAYRVVCQNGISKKDDASHFGTMSCTAEGMICIQATSDAYCAVCSQTDVSQCKETIPENAHHVCAVEGWENVCSWECDDGWIKDESINGCVASTDG